MEKAQGLYHRRFEVNKLRDGPHPRGKRPRRSIANSGDGGSERSARADNSGEENVLPPAALIFAAAAGLVGLLAQQLLALRRRAAELRLRLHEATVELEQANARLEDMATRDELTGIRNRRYFLEQLDLEWRRAMRTREPVSLVVADIDAFKALNDTYGHPEGDSSLARVAACMRAAARRSSDCVARIGGEEFAILLPGTAAEGAVSFAERVRRDVEALRIPNAGSRVCPVLTISLGVSTTRPKPADASPALAAAADRGMSRSKAAGCNKVTFEEWAPPVVSASARG